MTKRIETVMYKKLCEKWPDISSFIRDTKIPVSHETVRQVIIKGNIVGVHLIILIAKYLGFNSNEIKQILIDIGDTEFHPFFGGYGYLSEDEKVLIDIYRKINDRPKIIDYISILAQAEGKNIKKELQILEQYLKRRM